MKFAISRKKLGVLALLFVFSLGVGAAVTGISGWLFDNKRTEAEIAEVVEVANVTEVDGGEAVSSGEDEPSVYWQFLKMKMLEVDFSKLAEMNADTVGWVQVPGTNVNYPFVQTTDNAYYLKHSFNKSPNSAGWVFLDYRNSPDLTAQNNIIYAHGRLDSTMFGSLRTILTDGWLTDRANFVVRTATRDGSAQIWQIFSAYHLPTTSDYLTTKFASDEEFAKFLEMIKGRSQYSFGVPVTSSDQILTLSTCYNSSERMVVHAKLIKQG